MRSKDKNKKSEVFFLRNYVFLLLLISLIQPIFALPWSEEKKASLLEVAKKWEKDQWKYPIFTYPASAEDLEPLFEKDEILIFAYGSLINKESAARTLSAEAIDSAQPVLVFGMQRVFNYKSTKQIPSYRPNDVAMLNLFATGNLADIVNGVVMKVSVNDLSHLIVRETGYDLVPVIGTYWNAAIDPQQNFPSFFIAYTFVTRENRGRSTFFESKKINPLPSYVSMVKEGAKEYGEEFYHYWISTTYLADKITPFYYWELDHTIDCGQGPPCR